MQKINLLFCTLIVSIASNSYAKIKLEDLPRVSPHDEIYLIKRSSEEPKQQFQSFAQKYGTSILAGATCGVLNGYGCSKFETYMFGKKAMVLEKIFCFLVFNSITSGALKITTEGFDEFDIQYNEKALYSSQWLASWIAYLML